MMTAHDTVEYMIKHMTDPDNKICINIKPGKYELCSDV